MALQALGAYAEKAYSPNFNLIIKVKNGADSQIFSITAQNSIVLQSYEVFNFLIQTVLKIKEGQLKNFFFLGGMEGEVVKFFLIFTLSPFLVRFKLAKTNKNDYLFEKFFNFLNQRHKRIKTLLSGF